MLNDDAQARTCGAWGAGILLLGLLAILLLATAGVAVLMATDGDIRQ